MEQSFHTEVVQNLSQERLQLIQEASKACEGKTGMERLDVFIQYGEKLTEGEELSKAEQKALLEAVAKTLPETEKKQLEQMMQMMQL